MRVEYLSRRDFMDRLIAVFLLLLVLTLNLPGVYSWAGGGVQVIGAGPTGVEFTGELTDLIGTDVPRLFPELIGFISVTVVSAGNMVLPMFETVRLLL